MRAANKAASARRRAETGAHGAEHLERWRWKPGQTGNPNKVKRRTFTDDARDLMGAGLPVEWRKKLAARLEIKVEQLEAMTSQQLLVAVMLKDGLLEGDWRAAGELLDRVDPKPRRVELTGPGGTPLGASRLAKDLDGDEAKRTYQDALVEAAGDS